VPYKFCKPATARPGRFAGILIDKGLHVIECNTRFGGASTASIAAGLDSFYWGLLESSGVDMSDYPFLRTSGEVRQVRVPSDIYLHGSTF